MNAVHRVDHKPDAFMASVAFAASVSQCSFHLVNQVIGNTAVLPPTGPAPGALTSAARSRLLAPRQHAENNQAAVPGHTGLDRLLLAQHTARVMWLTPAKAGNTNFAQIAAVMHRPI
jgi:hypothetical protein